MFLHIQLLCLLIGIPAVYFNSLFGKSNDEAKYIITGNKRDVNRYKWNYKNILKKLDNKNSKQSIFFQKFQIYLMLEENKKHFIQMPRDRI